MFAYPSFHHDSILEADASIQVLGAVLSQVQADGLPHPIAYASSALFQPEKNYSITELETLAVVWVVTHFHTYLYGHKVTMYTDYSAVTAVFETPNLTGKFAQWWTRVYGRGVKEVIIVYRPGRTNTGADAVFRITQVPELSSDDSMQLVPQSHCCAG